MSATASTSSSPTSAPRSPPQARSSASSLPSDWGETGAAARADGDRRRRGRGARRGLLRPGAQPRRPDARGCARRPGAALGGRARGALGNARRLAGEGAGRVPVQGHRQPAARLPAPARRPPRRLPAPADRPPAPCDPARRVRPLGARATSSASRSAAATSASSTAPTSRRSGARWRSRSSGPSSSTSRRSSADSRPRRSWSPSSSIRTSFRSTTTGETPRARTS